MCFCLNLQLTLPFPALKRTSDVGIEFDCSTARVGLTDYTFWFRDLLQIVELLLEQVGEQLEFPVVRSDDCADPISTLWHGSVYQEHLKQFAAAGANLDRDLLLPLIFFSGVILHLLYSSRSCVHCR